MIPPPDQAPAVGVPADVRAEDGKAAAGKLVGRNMFALVASQFVTTPVSMVVNALLARFLGASNFGAIYLATTVLTLAFLFVEWGGYSQVAAAVARDRSSAPRVFGTGIVLRLAMASMVLLLIPYFGAWMEYDDAVRMSLTFVGLRLAFVSIGSLCSAVLRGFERIHWVAMATVGGNLLDATMVGVALLIGGGFRAILLSQVVSAALAVTLQLVLIGRLRIGRLQIDRGALQVLVGGGFSFLVLDIILKLQPYIDATFLEKLAEPQALGWYSAANRIMGVLMFPALTLNTALYPTLARLWQDDRETCNMMVRLGLRTVMLIGVLAATGAVIFAPFVVNLVYGSEGYGPAAMDLSILSAYVLLVYMSIVLGSFLAAAGRQWKWALAQSVCVIVSMVLDPILIPWTQQRYGNGSLGVCISVVTAEVAMVAFGVMLLPVGPFNRSLARTFFRCIVAATGTAVVGFSLRAYPLIGIPATILTYVFFIWIQREMDPEMLVLLPPGLVNAARSLQRSIARS